jgi:hypothetical protein
MSIPMRPRVLVTIAWVVHAACVLAAPDPPPDPRRGEGYGGQTNGATLADDLRVVPRIILMPVRVVWRGLTYPFVAMAAGEERYHVSDHLYAILTTDDGLVGVRPEFSYQLSFKPTGGLRLFDRRLFGPTTNFELTMATGGLDIVYVSAYARPTPLRHAVAVEAWTIYNRRDDQLFTGVGSGQPLRASRYAIEQVDLRGQLRLLAATRVRLLVGAMYGLRRFRNGESVGGDPPIASVYCVRAPDGSCVDQLVDEQQVPGFTHGTQFVRGWAALHLDSRDHPFRPASGGLLDLGVDYTHGVGDDDSSYFRLHGVASLAVNLWRRTRVLVLRVAADDIEPASGTVVPFSELVVLGGPDNFRGFRPGRFRDYSALLVGAEYRWPIWMWMDASVFAEYGGVFAQHFGDFDSERLHPDVGAGVRIRSSRLFLFRMQVAYGWSDGWQFFISASPYP